jgi:2-polyprenyl-6-methoxyphenol hydroxylase-like FAD-dependent oxidoreductase
VRPVETVLVPPPWYRGRVLLIGDAAHATSPHVGQGAAQAIEDGVVLAEELAAKDLDAALEGFMERRFARCKIVIDGSKQIGDWEKEGATMHPDYPGTVARITNAVAAPL